MAACILPISPVDAFANAAMDRKLPNTVAALATPYHYLTAISARRLDVLRLPLRRSGRCIGECNFRAVDDAHASVTKRGNKCLLQKGKKLTFLIVCCQQLRCNRRNIPLAAVIL